MQERGQLEVLLRSLGRWADGVEVQGAQARGELQARDVRSVGPALVVGRVWRDLGIDRVLREALEGRKYAFDVGRTVFASVVHRLFESGSARPWRSCAGSRISGKRGRRCEKPWNSLPVSLKGTEETGLESLRKALETSPETPPPERLRSFVSLWTSFAATGTTGEPSP